MPFQHAHADDTSLAFAAGALIGAAIVAIIKFRKKKLFDSSL